MNTEIVVVGSGIAGISCAHFLQEAGYDVIVLEEKTIASGATGQSTGILWYGSGLDLISSIKQFGPDNTKVIWEESDSAIEEMKKLIEKNNIDCDWRSAGAIFCARNQQEDEFLIKELDAMKKFGFPAKLIGKDEIKSFYSFSKFTSGLVENCSQIYPLKFVSNLVKRMNIRVSDNSPMTGFEERNEEILVKTPVDTHTCSKLIVATNFKPFFGLENHFIKESTVALYSQVFGEKLKEIWPEEKIFWTLDELYDMIYPQNGKAVLELYRYKEVDSKLKQYFPGIDFQISEQRFGSWAKPKDSIPLIGRVKGNVFSAIAMGDQGIVMGFACGRNIVNMIEDKKNDFLKVTSPSRLFTIGESPGFNFPSFSCLS